MLRGASALAGVLLLAAVAGLIVTSRPWFMSRVEPTLLHRMLEGRLVALFGARSVVTGEVRLSLWPAPHLLADGVAVEGLPGQSGLQHLSASGLRAGIALGDLILGRVVISRLELDRPLLRIRRQSSDLDHVLAHPGDIASATAWLWRLPPTLIARGGTMHLTNGRGSAHTAVVYARHLRLDRLGLAGRRRIAFEGNIAGRSASISGEVTGGGRQGSAEHSSGLRISKLIVALGETMLTGSASIRGPLDRIHVAADLSGATMRLDDFGVTARDTASRGDQDQETERTRRELVRGRLGFADLALPTDFGQRVSYRVRLAAENFQAGAFAMSGASVKAIVADKRARIEFSVADGVGGPITGAFRLDNQGPVPLVDLSLIIDDVDLAAASRMAPDPWAGTIRVHAGLAGAGTSVYAILAGLAGNISIAAESMRMPSAAFGRTYGPVTRLAMPWIHGDEAIHIENLNSRWVIAGGRAVIREATLGTSDVFASIVGSVDWDDGIMHIEVNPVAVDPDSGSDRAAAIVVGPLTQPAVLPAPRVPVAANADPNG